VDVWRFQKSLERTKERRPELYDKYVEEHPDMFTAKSIKKRNKILDKIAEAEQK
jgi:tRNA (guanine37-N1)-methyltransferase